MHFGHLDIATARHVVPIGCRPVADVEYLRTGHAPDLRYRDSRFDSILPSKREGLTEGRNS